MYADDCNSRADQKLFLVTSSLLSICLAHNLTVVVHSQALIELFLTSAGSCFQ